MLLALSFITNESRAIRKNGRTDAQRELEGFGRHGKKFDVIPLGSINKN